MTLTGPARSRDPSSNRVAIARRATSEPYGIIEWWCKCNKWSRPSCGRVGARCGSGRSTIQTPSARNESPPTAPLKSLVLGESSSPPDPRSRRRIRIMSPSCFLFYLTSTICDPEGPACCLISISPALPFTPYAFLVDATVSGSKIGSKLGRFQGLVVFTSAKHDHPCARAGSLRVGHIFDSTSSPRLDSPQCRLEEIQESRPEPLCHVSFFTDPLRHLLSSVERVGGVGPKSPECEKLGINRADPRSRKVCRCRS